MIAPATELVSVSLPVVPLTVVGGAPGHQLRRRQDEPVAELEQLEIGEGRGAVRRTCPRIGQRDAAVRIRGDRVLRELAP